LPALGEVLSGLLYRLHVALSDAAYNLTINSAPRRHVDEPDFVWHIEILPRISAVAGFEFATGMAINTVLPEQAADRLRGIWVPE
jgi:UDPglucose--hexose-1-phosphate uridylyltransferase